VNIGSYDVYVSTIPHFFIKTFLDKNENNNYKVNFIFGSSWVQQRFTLQGKLKMILWRFVMLWMWHITHSTGVLLPLILELNIGPWEMLLFRQSFYLCGCYILKSFHSIPTRLVFNSKSVNVSKIFMKTNDCFFVSPSLCCTIWKHCKVGLKQTSGGEHH